MSDKKPKLVAVRKKRNARRAVAAKPNPPLGTDAMTVLLPGVGAYAATRALSRVVYSVVSKRAPRLGKHAHAAAGVVAFAAVWLLGHRIQRLAKYHDAVVMGSGMAAFQGVARAYLPAKYNWLLADPVPEPPRGPRPPFKLPVQIPDDEEATPVEREDDLGEFAHLESQLRSLETSGSRRARTAPAPRASRAPIADQLAVADVDDGDDREVKPIQIDPDLMQELGDEDVDDLYTGAFDPN